MSEIIRNDDDDDGDDDNEYARMDRNVLPQRVIKFT